MSAGRKVGSMGVCAAEEGFAAAWLDASMLDGRGSLRGRPLTPGSRRPVAWAAAARLPASHESQLADPVALTYLPVSHGAQLDWPVAPWYVPESQSVQII